MSEQTFEHFFKPEVRRQGVELASQEAVYLRLGSDRQIDASIRSSKPLKVSFRSASIESSAFTVDCSCTSSGRGQFCKHIWATLVVGLEKSPDFFDSKTTIEKINELAAVARPASNPRNEAYKDAQQERQRQYAKDQRARAKEFKSGRAEGLAPLSKLNMFLPASVQEALKYFEQNGFAIDVPIDQEALSAAKRLLSRVFHPDKGGSQDEILELNRHADTLQAYRG